MGFNSITGYEFLDYIDVTNSFKRKENDIMYYYLYLNTDDLPEVEGLESPLDLLEPYFKSVDDYYINNDCDTDFIDEVFSRIADNHTVLFKYDYMNLNVTDVSMQEIVLSYFDCDKVIDKLETIVNQITRESFMF